MAGAPDPKEWRLIERYALREYPCGLRAGDTLRLRSDLHVRDHELKPTGEVHAAGELWVVLNGVADEPETVWLREPNGDSHTWDAGSILESFEHVPGPT